MDNKPPSDEIDLGRLFANIGASFRRGWLNLMHLIARIRNIPFENKLSFTLIITVSIILGFVFSKFLNKNYYETSMILSSDYLNKRLAENTVDKLSQLARESNKDGLAKTLALSDSMAKNIIGFDVRPFVEEKDIVELEVLKEQLRNAQLTTDKKSQVIDEIVERIEIENRHAFEITVRTLTPSVIGNLQDAIVGYFRNNPYIRKRIEIEKANLLEKKTKLEGDLSKLDSLKTVMNENYRNMAEQSRQGSNNVILSDKAITDPIQVYNRGLEIYAQYQEVNRELYLQRDFEIVEGFTEFSEPASPSLFRMLLYSVLLGIGIAYFDVFIRSFNRYLTKLEHTNEEH